MDRLRRSLLLLAASLLVTLVVVVFRGVTATDVLREVAHQFRGTCTALAGRAEDLEIDSEDRLLFASFPDGSSFGASKKDAAGLYVLPLDRPENNFKKLAGTPANFRPHGISLFRGGDGSLVLAAVDRPAGEDPAIEIFDVHVTNGAVSLTQRASVTGGLLPDPAVVAAAGPDQFYVTNGSTSSSAWGRALDSFGLLPRGDIVYFDGNVFRIVADGINRATGIRLAADGHHLYVAASADRTLYTYERDPLSGSLRNIASLEIGPGLAHIGTGSQGSLLVAARPKRFAPLGGASTGPQPTQVFKVALSGGIPVAENLIYADPGTALSAASAAALSGNVLFIASPRDEKVLRCRVQGE